MKKPAAVAIYARISSDQEGTARGVKRQVEDCQKLAEQLGWNVAEVYQDNDVSAYSGKRRPAYDRMLADLRDGLRDAVIVYHHDRLTRRPIELEQFLEVLSAAGVRQVRFVAGADVDVANGDGLLVLRLLAAVAANESDAKSRRVKRKLAEVAAEGRPHGGSRRPFGFDDDKIAHRPDEAEVIRTLAARYLAGESFRSLATWLENDGVRTVYNKTWTTTTVRDVLMSPRIAGLREYNGEVFDAVWEPIISVDDHQRIVAQMDRNKRTKRRANRRYLLTGLLRCGNCGNKLFSAARERTRRYVCQSGPDHGGCGRLTIVAGPLEELITAAVLYRLDTPELAAALTGQAAADEQTAAIAEAVTSDNRQLEELAQLYAENQITAREWMTARKPIEQRRRHNERRLAQMTSNDALVGIVGNGEELRGQWSTLNLGRQAAIIQAVIDHATIAPAAVKGGTFDPNRVDIAWRV